MTHFVKRQIRTLLRVVVVGALAGLGFSIGIHFLGDSAKNAAITVRYAVLGIGTGFGISLLSSFSEMLLMRILKNPPLIFTILIKPLLFTIIILIVYSFMFTMVFPEIPLLNGGMLPITIIFSLSITFVITFLEIVNRLLGQHMLIRLIIGRYNRPVREERFFMFLDMVGSTGIAEKIGDVAFHQLLRDFFFDITEPLLACQAEIYKYVGDEVILTWKPGSGIKNGNVLSVFFACKDRIEELSGRYQKRYGLVPEFRAGLHYGSVIVGEMGSYKMEIAYLGDVMNTASRIQSACSIHNVNFLASKEVLNQFSELDSYCHPVHMGSLPLKGKERELELYAIEEPLMGL